MNEREKSNEQPRERRTVLPRAASEAEMLKTIVYAQRELTMSWARMEQTSAGRLMLKSMLLKIIQLANQIVQAEESSIFLLDAEGKVRESILARGATLKAQKRSIIGQVLDKGLAGWVIRHHKIGLIEDTMRDERWLTLPNEPYKVRSALCVPLLKGKTLLGLLTMMHSQPKHFNSTSHAIASISDLMALVLDNAQLYIALQNQGVDRTETLDPLSSPPMPSLGERDRLEFTGIYIMTTTGNLLYANHRFAEIFDYSFTDLVSLGSIFDFVASDSYHLINKQLDRCLKGLSKYLYCTFTGRKKKGSLIDVEIEGSCASFYGQSVLIGAVRPI